MSNYIIIDGTSFAFSACSGNKILNDNGIPIKVDGKFTYSERTLDEVYFYLDNMLIRLFNNLTIGNYIGFVDYSFSKNFRLKYYPEYKGNRKDKIPPKYIKEAKDRLITQWNFITAEIVESDDLCKICHKHYKDNNSILCSIDKDLLKTEGVTYNPVKDIISVNTEYDEEYEFCKSMIIGDSTDNIKGIKGIGEVGAKNILESIEADNNLLQVVFDKYLSVYGKNIGVEEFYKNYKCLHILDNITQLPENYLFTIPDFQKVPGTF